MNEKAPSSFRVGSGRNSVLVSRWVNAGGYELWRFKSPATGRHVRRAKQSEARRLAREHLDAVETGEREFLEFSRAKKLLLARVMAELRTEADLVEALEFLKSRRKAKLIPALVDDYLAHKIEEKGHLSRHLQAVRRDLSTLAARHEAETLGELTTETLKSWMAERVGKVGAKRKNDCRTNLLSLYNFAHKMGELPDDRALLVARRLPIVQVERLKAIRYAHKEEALFLLRNVRPDYRLWMILGMFAGLRPEEVVPEKGRFRRGLDRAEIDDETATVYIPREVAGKAKAARRVPFPPNFEAWLEWAGWNSSQVGPIAAKSAARADETWRLGKLLDEHFQRAEGWPADILRHTYASHRSPIIKSLPALALEMGNSEKILKEHYNQPLPEAEAEAFFQLLPADLAGGKVLDVDFKLKREDSRSHKKKK